MSTKSIIGLWPAVGVPARDAINTHHPGTAVSILRTGCSLSGHTKRQSFGRRWRNEGGEENGETPRRSRAGRVGLQNLDASGNSLPVDVLDTIFSQLHTNAPALGFADLPRNAVFPSAVGYGHHSSLTNRGVTVSVDLS